MTAPPGIPRWALPDRPNPPDPLGGGTPVELRPGTSAAWFQYDRSLQFWTGGGVITLAMMQAAQADGYAGMFLDPAFVWTMGGLAINGLSSFRISSAMTGTIGWLASIAITTGYIAVDEPLGDGIQVFASSPASAPTQGIIFERCVIKGANPGHATFHLGGGQRQCGLVDTLVQNTSSAVNSYGVVSDTALSDNNSEKGIFTFSGGGGIASGWCALGLGVGDQAQHSNDTLWSDLTTSGGTYGINCANASNHTFTNYYDRSNPATATVNMTAGVLSFVGGEDVNAAGASYVVAGGTLNFVNRLLTSGGITISAGSVEFRGRCRLIGTIAVSGTGNVDLSDPAGSWGNATVTGSSGTLMLAAQYSPASGPVVSGWTGTTLYQTVTGGLAHSPVVQASTSGTASTTTKTLSWTPPAANVAFRVHIMCQVTTAGTSTVPNLAFKQLNGATINYAPGMWQQNGAATTPVFSIAATGTFEATIASMTDTSATAVVVTLTPTGSTFNYMITIEQITGSGT